MPRTRATIAILVSLLGATQARAEDTNPYRVEVWANVLFGADGRPVEYTLDEEEKYPPEFASRVKAQVAQAKVSPPDVQGKPVTLRTGVRLGFEVTPGAEGGAQVRLTGLSMSALPTKRYYASYPRDVGRTRGWTGEVEGHCRVGLDGHCASIEIRALPGMPESVRRFARASLEGWSFMPQEIDGKPVESDYVLKLRLNTRDDRPENFRQDKFLRTLKTR